MAKKSVQVAPSNAQTAVATAVGTPTPQITIEVGPDLSQPGLIEVDARVGRIAVLVEAGEESQVLCFRGAEYHLPKQIVSSPLPTLTFRHLEKVQMYAFAGKREKVESAVKRAIASAIDTASLVKIACVAHSEGFHMDATVALSKAFKCAKKDQKLRMIASTVAGRLGYHLGA